MAKLVEGELKTFLTANPNWTLADGVLVREWAFKNFVEAMAFVNRVATLAEGAGHHPDIDIRYNKVRLSLISHDSGGVTDRDTELATRLNVEI